MSEVMHSLKASFGKEVNVEIYDRIIKLHERTVLSENIDVVKLGKTHFETMTSSLLDDLKISIKQMKMLSNEHAHDESEYVYHERFHSLITDLRKSGMIEHYEYETLLENPRESTLPWILHSLKDEAEHLLSALSESA